MLAATRSTTGRGATPRRPRLGIMKFASCDGCQLTLLDLENELLDLVTTFDLVEFAEASSHRSSGPFDLVLVEGSISTPDQIEEIVHIRRETPLLVTIGACATAGGIQALRNWRDHEAMHNAVYALPEYVEFARHLDAGLRPRHRRCGAAWLPDLAGRPPGAADLARGRSPAPTAR